MIVLSTGLSAATRHLCEASVRAQICTVPIVHHIYIDASEQSPPPSRIQNLLAALDAMSDDQIVVLLDGDDWLARPDALQIVANAHAAGAWITHGSYMTADGEPGICAPYLSANYRREPWKASHLKTFRASLFHKIRPESFLGPDGKLIEHCTDQVLMFPMLEMAGPSRVKFIKETLYVYNFASSYEKANGNAAERATSEWLRAQKPYEVLP
jgi:hypothetical protein